MTETSNEQSREALQGLTEIAVTLTRTSSLAIARGKLHGIASILHPCTTRAFIAYRPSFIRPFAQTLTNATNRGLREAQTLCFDKIWAHCNSPMGLFMAPMPWSVTDTEIRQWMPVELSFRLVFADTHNRSATNMDAPSGAACGLTPHPWFLRKNALLMTFAHRVSRLCAPGVFAQHGKTWRSPLLTHQHPSKHRKGGLCVTSTPFQNL